MSVIKFHTPKFVKTVVSYKDYPVLKDDRGVTLPEIAVAGRSNVGKSTLLNHLFQRQGLVKTSSTPGKTQALNFFSVDNRLLFVDLPGYGYASVPMAVRHKWGPLIEGYLSKREELKLILFLFDIRRTPNQEDMQLMEWIIYHQHPFILVLTKADKVNQKEKAANTKAILEAFNVEEMPYVHYSVPKNRGRTQLLAMITEVI